MAKKQENGVLLEGLKKERAEIIQLYKKHEITAAQCIAEKNRLDELIQKAGKK